MNNQELNNYENDYFQVHRWMITELNLKGLERDIYAIIYGFSRNGINKFYGSLSYLCSMTNTTKQGVIKALKSLLDKKLIAKEDNIVNEHYKTCVYYATNVQHTVSKNKAVQNQNEEKTSKKREENRSTLFTAIQTNIGKQSSMVGKLSSQIGKLSLPNNNIYNYNKAASSEAFLSQIKNKIESLFSGPVYDDSVYTELSEQLYKLSPDSIEDYLDYVYLTTKNKKPNSITKMFYTLLRKDDVYQDYLYKQNNKSGDAKPLLNIKKVCPNCGKTVFSVQESVYGYCSCGWDFDNAKIIKKQEEIAN